MSQPPLAISMDYQDALLIARRWKNRLVATLLFVLLIQIGTFGFVRFYQASNAAPATPPATPMTTVPSTMPAEAALDAVGHIAWLINVCDFVAIIAVVALCAVLWLILAIMLVGRLVGISRMTSALLWCMVLALLLFPWQALWDYSSAGMIQSIASDETRINSPQFGLPGILYTWPELKNRAHFTNDRSTAAVLGWARFTGWPAVAVILLMSVHLRGGFGLKLALGEKQLMLTPNSSQPPA